MKLLTKDWYKDCELCVFKKIVNSNDNTKKLPLVLLNGGINDVEGKDLYTVKTNLNVTEQENQISFLLLPDDFDFLSLSDEDTDPAMKTYENQFFAKYINKLRIISTLPEHILKLIKDKRLLALGYATDEVKVAIKDYIGNKFEEAIDKFTKSNKKSELAGKDLTACRQLKGFPFSTSLTHILQETFINEFNLSRNTIQIETDGETIFLHNAKVILQEINPKNKYILAYELYKNKTEYELHFLLSERDKNLIEDFYYSIYAFEDMMLKN